MASGFCAVSTVCRALASMPGAIARRAKPRKRTGGCCKRSFVSTGKAGKSTGARA